MRYDFTHGQELLACCAQAGEPIHRVMLRREAQWSERPEEQIWRQMQENWTIMCASARRGIEQAPASVGGLVGGEARKIQTYADHTPTLGGVVLCRAAARAMAVVEVNAAMGRIVAAPTAGASGVLPGVLMTVQQTFGYTDEHMVQALFTAAAVGMLVQRNASVAGAEGGCQAEVGTAAAMAAAALVELREGTPEQALDAAATALQNLMGLVCDPVAGLVEVPCVKRNAIGAANALLCADLALAGVGSLIPFDQTVEAMYAVGCALPPSLRESGQGGLAGTPKAKEIADEIFHTDSPCTGCGKANRGK